ncbi:MAG: RNA polymerase sigma factor [Pirellulales bacterium]|nr:RNA polymerase sigma factor [Pirellulales bacterium]
MVVDPETRASLILRLGNPADDLAWTEFLQIYEPMLFRLASRWGLQENDVVEVVQETLLAVANSVAEFQGRDHAGAFRGWLAAITRHKLADHLAKRSKQQTGTGDSEVHRWLDQQADRSSSESVWDWQSKQQIFAWAAERVRKQVNPATWEAFHRTNVLGQPVAKGAEDLGMRGGMVYVARSRVMARLRKAVEVWLRQENTHQDQRGER